MQSSKYKRKENTLCSYAHPKSLKLGVCRAAAAKSRQSCPVLGDPRDSSPPGSSVHGILQARTLEWVAISSSNAWKWKVKVKSLSHVRLLATPWTAAHQAPPSMGFSRQEYWSGVPLPSPVRRASMYELERGINVHPEDNHRKLWSMPPLSITRRFLGF